MIRRGMPVCSSPITWGFLDINGGFVGTHVICCFYDTNITWYWSDKSWLHIYYCVRKGLNRKYTENRALELRYVEICKTNVAGGMSFGPQNSCSHHCLGFQCLIAWPNDCRSRFIFLTRLPKPAESSFIDRRSHIPSNSVSHAIQNLFTLIRLSLSFHWSNTRTHKTFFLMYIQFPFLKFLGQVTQEKTI
jgi:hypothetical protein